MDGTKGRARDGTLCVGSQAGDPKVGDHRPPVAREQDVAGLHVPMDDAADVGYAQTARDLQPDPYCLSGAETPDPRQTRREVFAIDEFHHQVRLSIVGSCLQTGDDVRVAQHRGSERFAPEAHRDIRVRDDLATKELDRDAQVEPPVIRPMDGRHATDPDPFAQQIAIADEATDIGGCGVWGEHVTRLGHAPTIADQAFLSLPRGSRRSGQRGMERETRLELATCSLEGCRSTN